LRDPSSWLILSDILADNPLIFMFPKLLCQCDQSNDNWIIGSYIQRFLTLEPQESSDVWWSAPSLMGYLAIGQCMIFLLSILLKYVSGLRQANLPRHTRRHTGHPIQ
jgi:hypothetical protein